MLPTLRSLHDLGRPLLEEDSPKLPGKQGQMQAKRWKGHPVSGPIRSLLPTEAACLLVLLAFTGVPAWLFYMLADGAWTHGEALYFSVVTLTTVGYGDYVPPEGSIGKILLIFLVWWNALVVNIVVGVLGKSMERRVERVGSLLGKAIGHRRAGIELAMFLAMVSLFLTCAYCFYHYEEKSWMDGVFFATVTLTTTGYGHLTPSSFRLLAGPLVLFAVAAWEALSGHFSEALQQRVNRAMSYRSRAQRRRVTIMLVCGTIFLAGSAFYMITSQGWTLQECCYFCAITATTVGFGDYIPFGTREELWLATIFIFLLTPFLPQLLDTIGSEAVQLSEEFVAVMTRRMSMRESIQNVNGKAVITAEFRRLVHMLLLGLLLLGGACVFSWLESWTMLEGLYFASVTLTTVGYGDMCPSSPLSRWLVMIYVVIGVPTAGTLVEFLSNGYSSTLRSALRRPGRQAGAAAP